MRGVAQHYPDRIEALSVNPARAVSPDVAKIGRFEGLQKPRPKLRSRSRLRLTIRLSHFPQSSTPSL